MTNELQHIARPELPDPETQNWEWIKLLAAGDERAWEFHRQRKRVARQSIEEREESARLAPEPDDGWDILEALNETRLAAGRPPLFEEDEQKDSGK